MRNRRTSGRGRTVGLLISVMKVSSDCALVAGSLSAMKAEETAQSSQDEQYFSGVCVSLLPDLISAGLWQGAALASVIFTELTDIST